MAYNGAFNIQFACNNQKTSTPSFGWGAASDAALIALAGALDGISTAVVGKQFVTERREVAAGSSATPPGDAGRGKKFVISYNDNVTNDRHQVEIPGADDDLLAPGSINLDVTAGVGLAVKNTFETAVVSPAGNATTVTAITFQTRNIE
jgi:hypothetical protein